MSNESVRALNQRTFDVVICGGGLAGLTLSRQIRRSHPDLDVLLVEKIGRPLPEAAHKVGESSVELGSQYLERLGLREHLIERHLIKHGLRFFPGGGTKPLEERVEIGPAQEPVVPSYQIDRGRFENEMRDMVVDEDGVLLVEGATVGAIELGAEEAPHTVYLRREDEEARVHARWVVDATGRNALLRRRLKLTRGTRHEAHAGWFRVEGRIDITDLVPKSEKAWHEAEWAPHRWRSTNHLMGEGYWAWIIPLSSGNTSVGVVVHDHVHGFDSVRTLERVHTFLASHETVLANALEGRRVLDFRCLKGYSHNVARGWSRDRWAIVGEAGAFVDPLYSPGTDYIAFANSFTEELIRVDRQGGDLDARARELNVLYRALVKGNVDLFRDAAAIYAHPKAMLAKIYWDNFSYWSYPCQLFLQEMYRQSGEAFDRMQTMGRRFVELSSYVQKILGAWAEREKVEPEPGFRGMPAFPSVLIDAHLALQERMSPEQTIAYMRQRLEEGEEIVGELLLRTVSELREGEARAVVEAAGVSRWELRIPRSRLEAVGTVGLARRRTLSPLARDVERTLGKPTGSLDRRALSELLSPVLVDSPRSSAPLETAG